MEGMGSVVEHGNTRRRSRKQEKEVAKVFGGRENIASGSFWWSKSDVRTDRLLIECKTTKKDYFILYARLWDKIREEAIKDGLRIPLMAVDLQDKYRYVIFDPNDFENDIPWSRLGFRGYHYTTPGRTYRLVGKEFKVENLTPNAGIMFKLIGARMTYTLFAMKSEDFMHYYSEEL